MGVVEDEFHVAFECLAYSHLRQQYSGLFTQYICCGTLLLVDPDLMMQNLFQQPDKHLLAKFLIECHKTRLSIRGS